MIVSFTEGRVRLRSRGLCDGETISRIKGLLAAQEGVLDVKGNPRVGSLLVTYDPGKVPPERLEAATAMLESMLPDTDGESRRRSCLTGRKCENRLMLVSAVTCLVGAIKGWRNVHITAGSICTLLAAKHLFDRQGGL
ncbi:MAG: hypothetical protein LBR22_07315 [Desulfovibrio sp.]|jgi:hypothetical protein|nr:hypothetical protein [Desulfovibrio sp.]